MKKFKMFIAATLLAGLIGCTTVQDLWVEHKDELIELAIKELEKRRADVATIDSSTVAPVDSQ